MKGIEQFYSGFYLDKESENSQISGNQNPLRVAPLKVVNKYEALEIDTKHFAFAEKNKNGIIEYFHGLNNFLQIKKNNNPSIFIFDNHNHAPIFWHYTTRQSRPNPPILIHIDQHSDCWKNKEALKLNKKEYDLGKVFHFYNEKCNVGNFIQPSLKSGIISNQIQIRSSTALQSLKIENNQNYILDIDLDFCLSGIDRTKTDNDSIDILKTKFNELWESASCITIATSPYFLDQNIAIEIIKTIFMDKKQ